MRITFVLPGRSMRRPVGGHKVVYEYANGLVNRGHQVNVIHPLFRSQERPPFMNKSKIYCKYALSSLLGIPKVRWFKISPKVNMITVLTPEEKYIPLADVIIATSWQTAEWVNQYNPDKGEKYYLVQGYETWSGDEKRVEATWKLPLKKVVVSKWLENIAQNMGEQIAGYVPNGLNLKHFRIINPIDSRNPKRVGMLYSNIICKGSEDGIKALSLVKGRIPDLQAAFFGVSPRGKVVPKWAEYHQNPSLHKLVKIYNSCSIFVGSSWYEGWFLPGSEAMACGCAVVSTDCGGIREYAKNEVNALLSPPADPDALAQNLLRVLQDQNLCMKLAREGNEIIKSFTWHKAVEKMEAFLLGRLV